LSNTQIASIVSTKSLRSRSQSQAELGANKQIYVTQIDAAGQIRNAVFEAAKLRQTAAIIAAVGRETQEKSDKACALGSDHILEMR